MNSIGVRTIYVTIPLIAGLASWMLWSTLRERTELPAIALNPPGKRFNIGSELKPENILALLTESKLTPISSQTAVVKEPELIPGQFEPPEAESLGIGKSQFLVDSRWATIRFIGENPAGAGLTGVELNKAQSAALGTAQDTIPVITTAQTINDMMEQYFAPLLRDLPRGEDILSRTKIQGSYFAPRSTNADGTPTDRDNAFVVGVQSLFIYPSSCFDKISANVCSPMSFSAGHDPTIIGHELGHVIFNLIRDERSLEGWQWFAVNEGYADYFSASYFGDPQLGRIWRVNRPSGARYLRQLLDTPTTTDIKALQEGHAFGVVWSSALWRARTKLTSQFRINPLEFDKIVLLSINFLGESTKTKLGDAASAVLKAADTSGRSDWKNILVDEFKKAEIDLTRGQQLASASGEVISKQQGGISCGTLSTAKSGTPAMQGWTFGLLALPLLLLRRSKKRKRMTERLITTSFLPATFWLSGCQIANLWKTETPKPEGMAILYDCSLAALRDGTPSIPNQRKLSLTFPETNDQTKQVEQIFVGDERFENAASSLLMLVDKQTMRIDQVRRRDGRLFQLNLNQKYVSSEDALAVQNMRLGTILLEGVGRAMLNQKSKQPGSSQGTVPSAISLEMTGLNATATLDDNIMGARGFGPLPNRVTVDGNTLCTYQSVIR